MIYMTRYDLLLNFFLCSADMYILMKLMSRMYGPIVKYKKTAACIAYAGIVLLMILPAHYDNSFFTLPVSFLILGFYPKNFQKKLLFESCLFTIVFSYVFMLNDITNIIPRGEKIWVMRYLIGYHIGLWFLLFLCLKLCQAAEAEMPLSLWIIFLFIPVTTLSSSVILLWFLRDSSLERPIPDLMHLFMQATFLFVNIAVFDLFRRFSVHYKKEKERSLLEQQMKYQERHYGELLRINSKIEAVRHDMKNHLQTIALLYQNGSQKELLKYIDSTTAFLQQAKLPAASGNPYIDALLGIKLNEMKEKGIRCVPKLSLPQNLPLPFSDTVTILGNLLDNAVRSCAVCGEKTEIILSVVYQQNTLLFHMENPCREKTMKPYGTGLRNVVRAARKYSGTVCTKLENGNYTTDVVLYNL